MSSAWEKRWRDGLVSPTLPTAPSRMPWVPVHTISSDLFGSWAVWGHIQMQKEAVTPSQILPRTVSEDAGGSRHCSEGTDRGKLAQVLADPGPRALPRHTWSLNCSIPGVRKWLTRPGWEWICLPADGHAARGSNWATVWLTSHGPVLSQG